MKIKYGIIIIILFFAFFVPVLGIYLKFNDKTQEKGDVAESEFKVLDISTGEINEIKEKEYLKWAVLSEIAENFDEEAIKAQVVSTYTYAQKLKMHEEKTPDSELKGAHFKVDTKNAIGYINEEKARDKFKTTLKSVTKKVERAIEKTFGMVIMHNDAPIIASSHVAGAGVTESSEVLWGTPLPYLVSVQSDGDDKAKDYEFTQKIKKADFEKKAKEIYPDIAFSENIEDFVKITNVSEAKTVLNVTVGNKNLTGQDLRNIMSLRSLVFDVEAEKDMLKFTTYGLGHGVGLSQYGAQEMAKNGSSYLDIIEHYYPSTSVKNIK